MKRKLYDRLLSWKQNEAPKAALLIDGARRVGKSWLAQTFAEKEYRSHILIDFAKAPKEVKSLFEKYQDRLDTLFLRLSEYYGVRLYERQTLFVFDEVQMCPKARESIKHLVADGRYDYLETGSLVSIDENVEDIVIPSEEIRVKMFPMDFEEFLWAKGDETTMGFVKDHFDRLEPMGWLLHGKVMDAFREYMVVGGMPQAVAEFVDSADLGKVDAVKRRILKLYRDDIRKHAGRYALKTELVFDALAAQLSRHEKKFRLSTIGNDARMREYEDAFLWLKEAMVVNVAYRSTEPNIGLNLNAEHSTLKCYVADTGLLVSLAFNERQLLAEQIHKRLLFDALEINRGMFVENIVAQMLAATDHSLFFFSTTGDSRAERMEIDFLVPSASIGRAHNIRPLEVKSSRRYDHTSLDRFVLKYKRFLDTPVVLHSKDISQHDGILHLPLYMAGFL